MDTLVLDAVSIPENEFVYGHGSLLGIVRIQGTWVEVLQYIPLSWNV